MFYNIWLFPALFIGWRINYVILTVHDISKERVFEVILQHSNEISLFFDNVTVGCYLRQRW